MTAVAHAPLGYQPSARANAGARLDTAAYLRFLEAKVPNPQAQGFVVDPADIHPKLHDKKHQALIVQALCRGGRRACFAKFGLGKSVIQLETTRLCVKHANDNGLPLPAGATKHVGLIVAPLGVRGEFVRDAAMLGLTVKFIRGPEEIEWSWTSGVDLYLANYETIRDGKLDPRLFTATSLDEADVLRGFGGSKTFREFMRLFETVRYRFVATATPSPNEFIEFLAYAAYLGVMEVGEGKTRFFKRNSAKADELTLHPHKTREFWLWVASWAVVVQKPSDICPCQCHKDSTSSDSGSGASSCSPGCPGPSGTEPGSAPATAADRTSPPPITCEPAASSAADACDPSTAAREPAPTSSGKTCSTDADGPRTRIGPTTAAGASTSASVGSPSSTSSKTWDNPATGLPSTGSTTTAPTSRATASGSTGLPRPTTAVRTGRTSAPDYCSACRCNEGYDLPPVAVNWHEVGDESRPEEPEHWGQRRMFAEDAIGVVGASRVKRDTIGPRLVKALSLIAARPDDHCILWHDLEAERLAIEQALPSVVSVYGTQDLTTREEAISFFSNGLFQYLAAKPVLAGAGCNFQRHCHWAVFLGVGFKFRDFIQAVHRIVRFLQDREVTIDIVFSERERPVVAELKRKWAQHLEMEERMSEIIRQYGLGELALAETLGRSLVDPVKDRVEISGPCYRLVRNDCIHELGRMPDASVHLIVTSIPFGNMYEYSPTFNDLGHTDDADHFWRQMDFLIPQLFRVLQPGRDAIIHVKDRIVPGGINGLGFQTVSPFSDQCVARFIAHGFAFISRISSNTDVVKENNQTYRLAYGEQMKDGSRQGNGMPEYVLKFRRPPTDLSNGYADRPVVKHRPRHVDAESGQTAVFDQAAWQRGKIRPVPGDSGYSLARWQVDAAGVWRSSGDGLVPTDELAASVAWAQSYVSDAAFKATAFSAPPDAYRCIPLDQVASLEAGQVFKTWRQTCFTGIYRYEFHVAVGETLAFHGRLPSDFTLLPAHSLDPEVWTDVMQARGMNTLQAQANQEKHLCPLPFDIVERAIRQHSMPGETVLDPFGGLMTVPYLAVKMDRMGIGVELNAGYFADGCRYVQSMAEGKAVPGLFQWMGIDPVDEGMVQDVVAPEEGVAA
jgi:hypothetical protein